MFRLSYNLKRLILVLGDLAAFFLALLATLEIRYGHISRTDWSLHAWPFSIVFLLWITGLYVAGTYNIALLRQSLKLFLAYAEGMIANLLLAIAFFYLIPVFGIAPRTNLFLDFALTLLLGYLWRFVYLRFLDRHLSASAVLFIGPQDEVRPLYDLLEESPLGLKLKSAFSTSERRESNVPIQWIAQVDQLEQTIKEHHITTIVLGAHVQQDPELTRALYKTLFSAVAILNRTEIEEIATRRIPLTHVTQTWFFEHLRETDKMTYEWTKRFFDLILAIPFALFTLILLPFVALAIKLSSPGKIFYSQVRVGRHGANIRIWKFRTMKEDAEKEGPQFSTDVKTDPRITSVGRILRQLRVDELPQIWNVLKGDLSLIGPRPERPEFVEPLLDRMPYYQLRHLTKPGLTGWAQVLFLTPTSSLDDNLKKLQYDLYYIKHRSFLLDAAILLKTIGIVLKRQGT